MRFFLISLILHILLFVLVAYERETEMAQIPVRIKIIAKQPVVPSREQKKARRKLDKNAKIAAFTGGKKAEDTPRPRTISEGPFDPKKLLQDVATGGSVQDDQLYYGMHPVKNLHDQSYLQKFAADLNQFIHVPGYLTDNSQYMYGWVRVHRLHNRFIIKKYQGTPYGRAIIYEAVKAILARDLYRQTLEDGGIESFEVHFVFRELIDNGRFEPPPEFSVTYNRITINRFRLAAHPLARYVMVGSNPVTGLAQWGPNLLAPIMDLMEYFNDAPEKLPPDVRELHSSRAFRRHKN